MTEQVSFGQGRTIDFKGFNGIRKQDFKAEAGSKKEQLIKAFFASERYNKDGDDVLTAEDLKRLEQDILAFANSGKANNMGKNEAKDFMKSVLNLEGDFSREDLLEFLQEINADTDSVEFATTNSDGTTTVKYKPNSANVTKTEVYTIVDNKSVLSQDTVNYQDGFSTTTYYDNSGKSIKHTQTQGAVTSEYEHIHHENGVGQRLTREITKVGNDLYNVREYEYDGDRLSAITKTNYDKSKEVVTILDNGVKTITKYDAQGNKVSHSMENGENSFDTTYTTNSDGTRTETSTWKNGTVTRAVYDADENLQSRVNVDKEGNPTSYKHKVDKENDTWYGIVQAKYGVTDHKTTMEIVHQLKDAAGIKYNASTIPDEIELPAEITLKNGNKVSLNDVFGTVDQTHNVQKHINVKNSDNIPENMEVSADKKSVDYPSMPIAKQPEKQIDIQKILQKYPQNKDNAGKTVKSGDNWLMYDEQGRVINVYDHEPSDRDLNTVESFYYKDDGSLDGYRTRTKENGIVYESGYDSNGSLAFVNNNKFDDNGNIIESYDYYSDEIAPSYQLRTYSQNGSCTIFFYDSQGNLTNIQNDIHDNSGRLTRSNFYNSEGKLTSFHDKTYDELGREKRNVIYNSDGTVHETHITKYKSNSDSQWNNAEYYVYDEKGNLKG